VITENKQLILYLIPFLKRFYVLFLIFYLYLYIEKSVEG